MSRKTENIRNVCVFDHSLQSEKLIGDFLVEHSALTTHEEESTSDKAIGGNVHCLYHEMLGEQVWKSETFLINMIPNPPDIRTGLRVTDGALIVLNASAGKT